MGRRQGERGGDATNCKQKMKGVKEIRSGKRHLCGFRFLQKRRGCFFLKKWVKKRARQQASLLRGLTGFISLEDCDCLNSYNDFQSKKAILIQTS